MEFERLIVSGFDLDRDKIAHTAAVDIGKPTIAVLPSGVNNIYPERNIGLSKLILIMMDVLFQVLDLIQNLIKVTVQRKTNT